VTDWQCLLLAVCGNGYSSNVGQPGAEAENPDHWGDSVSSDSLVRKALIGEAGSTIVNTDGVLAPVVSIKSIAVVRDGSNIVGTVSTFVAADNAFVDGIKNSTGLDSSIYSGNVLSATTFVSSDGKTRQIGIMQTSGSIKKVLTKGATYKGNVNIFNRSYLAVYTPLKDSNNNVVGMLFIGQSSSAVLENASHSIRLTFIVAALLMVLSIIPAYVGAKNIARQLDTTVS